MIALAGQLLLSCGYQAVYGGRPPTQRLALTLVGPHIASLEAAAQVGAGLRDGLAAGHALAPGQGYPRVEFEVLRIDERATGIAQSGTDADPLGRGIAVAVVARAWVVERAGGPRLRDTGDVRRVRRLANAASLPRARADYETLVRAAARATGRALAARILGEPIATDQPL